MVNNCQFIFRTSFSSPRIKCNRPQIQFVRSAMDASFGDTSNDSTGNFSILLQRISLQDQDLLKLGFKLNSTRN